MDLKSAFYKIDRYLQQEDVGPLLVDVQNGSDRKAVIDRYNIPRNLFIHASDAAFCHRDKLPDTASLINRISEEERNVFVLEVSSFSKLKGDQTVKNDLKEFLLTSIFGHVVFITFQCSAYLQSLTEKDVRMKDRVCVIDGEVTARPNLIFTRRELGADADHLMIDGIHKLGWAAETKKTDIIYVATEKNAGDYPHSLYTITEQKLAYGILCQKDAVTANLPESLGTKEEWQYALSLFETYPSWDRLISGQVGDENHLDTLIFFWQSKGKDPMWRWLYLIGLKLYGAGDNAYLRTAAERAESTEEFVRNIYRLILEYAPEDPEFQAIYANRRTLLNAVGQDADAIADFCRIVPSKERDAIYYMTDSDEQEKELIFRLLDKYGLSFNREDLLTIFKTVYPDLYAYLSPYRFKNELLDTYFRDYKYQKVINKVLPEFLSVVEEQAVERSYNTILPPRWSITGEIDQKGAQTFFTDAWGVEYLSFILSRCAKYHLMAKVTVCHCDLPSITVRNKEFWDTFDSEEYPILPVREIDDIKHHGKYGFDYRKTKLPIHLIRELEVIDDLLRKIKTDFAGERYEKAILISDHGASRLAVINESESQVEMEQNGAHSGRCCPKSEVDIKPDHAADAGDFWALADYERFKGGRKANVEVHGGATLEEVAVPIIEITALNPEIEVKLMPLNASAGFKGIPEIAVSYRKKAAIKIFATQKLRDVSISVNGHTYDADPIDDQFYVVREMPEIRRAGDYHVDVYACGVQVAAALPLRVKKEVAGEKELF